MFEKFNLPPIQDFKYNLKIGNMSKIFQYLLYFAKNQKLIYETMSSQLPCHLTSQLIPTSRQREYIISNICQIMCLREIQNGFASMSGESLIMSSQKFIIGLIMLGHVHVYEILIQLLLPTFLKIIQGKINFAAQKFQVYKKINQFCKETLLLLSSWFPRCFYDQISTSWFRKIVNKHHITVKFIVHFDNTKLNKIEESLKELDLTSTQNSCLQCKYCLVNSGKKYQKRSAIPEMPSTIHQEDQIQASLVKISKMTQLKIKNKNDSTEVSETYNHRLHTVENIELQSKIKDTLLHFESNDNHQDPAKQQSRQKQTLNAENNIHQHFPQHNIHHIKIKSLSKQSSKVSQIFRKNRLARKKKIIQVQKKNNILQQQQYFISKTSEQNETKFRSRKYSALCLQNQYHHSTSIDDNKSLKGSQLSNNQNSNYSSSILPDRKFKSESNLVLLENKAKLSNTSKFNYLPLKQKKKKMEKKEKNSNKNAEKTTSTKIPPLSHYCNSYCDSYILKSKNNLINSLKSLNQPHNHQLSHQQTEINSSIFQSIMYRSMSKQTRRIFRKQCLNFSNKKVYLNQNIQIAELICKQLGTKLQIKINITDENFREQFLTFSTIHEKNNDNSFNIKMKKNMDEFIIDFKKCFSPISMKIGEWQILLPLSIISMLLPLKLNNNKHLLQKFEYFQAQIRLNKQIFQNLTQVIQYFTHGEEFEFFEENKMEMKFQFFNEPIILMFECFDNVLIQLKYIKNTQNLDKLQLLFKEIKKCLGKPNSNNRRIKIGNKKLNILETKQKPIIF